MTPFQIFLALSPFGFATVDHAIDEFLNQASAEEAAESVAADPDLFSERQKAIALDMQVGSHGLTADILAIFQQDSVDYSLELRLEAEERIRNIQLRDSNPVFYTREDEDGMMYQVRRDDVDAANADYTYGPSCFGEVVRRAESIAPCVW